MSKQTVKFALLGEVRDLPGKWVICDTCSGDGRTLPVGMRGSVYTEEERAQMDPEFFADLANGKYDETCEACTGLGKLLVVDEDKLDGITWNLYRRYQAEEWRFNREWKNEIRTQSLMMGEKP